MLAISVPLMLRLCPIGLLVHQIHRQAATFEMNDDFVIHKKDEVDIGGTKYSKSKESDAIH